MEDVRWVCRKYGVYGDAFGEDTFKKEEKEEGRISSTSMGPCSIIEYVATRRAKKEKKKGLCVSVRCCRTCEPKVYKA